MKTFNVPIIYRSPLITAIKERRRQLDKMKKDFTPTLLDFGSLQIFLARHFGFCYGVENAIEIAFRTIEDNPGKRIFLLSEMIHNPQVNADLLARGVRFLQDTYGSELISINELRADDIVITPAFGTTLEMESRLHAIGIRTEKYNTTCPFVERVWNRSEQIARKNYTVIIHGKPQHEETRATFSHAASNAPALILNDMEDAKKLAGYLRKEKPVELFYQEFSGRFSPGFDVTRDLAQIGVVNQTTMLASDTQDIADFLKQTMTETYGLPAGAAPDKHFADTRDTLCYATNDNQTAVTHMLSTPADMAFVVGGYNSSNTSHLVELCEKALPTHFVNDAQKILSREALLHFDFHQKKEILVNGYWPSASPVRILLTSGASCPDALVEGVVQKLVSVSGTQIPVEEMTRQFS